MLLQRSIASDERPPHERGRQRRDYRHQRLERKINSSGLDVARAGLEAQNSAFAWPDGELGAMSAFADLLKQKDGEQGQADEHREAILCKRTLL